MAPKEPTHTLNASELRATIAPILKAYQGLAAVNDVLEQITLEETRLRSLTKDRTTLEQAIAGLKTERDNLTVNITTARALADDAQKSARATADSVKAQTAKLDEARAAHQNVLDADKKSHEDHMAAIRKQHSTELDRAKQELATTLRQIELAKGKLTEFQQNIQKTLTAA